MNKKVLIVGAVFLACLVLIPSVSATWCNNDYGKKAPIFINNTGGSAQTYYQVELNFTHNSDINTNFSDIRVYNESDCSLIPLWNESAVQGSWNKIWANYTNIPTSSWTNDTYYLYYNYSSASTVSNITTTFLFGDVFAVDTFSSTDESTNPTRTADDAWEGSQVNEHSDFNYSGEYISWYRGNDTTNSAIGYENSTDGVSWTAYSGNPILNSSEFAWIPFPYVVQNGDCFYIFAQKTQYNLYLYNVTDHTNPIIMNDGNPVYTHSSTSTDWDYQIFNPAIVIDGDGRWHMLLEGKSSADIFRLGYAYSNLTEMNWSAHRSSSYVIDTAGNPYLKYVPDKNALLALHGDRSVPTWKIKAHYANLSDNLSESASWHTAPNFEIAHSGIHTCDPHAMFNFNATYPTMISHNYNQLNTYQTYSTLTLNEFYDEIIIDPLNKWEADTSYGSVSDGIFTYEGDGTWRNIYSLSNFTPSMALRTRINFENSDNSQIGFQTTPCCVGRSIVYNQGLRTHDDSDVAESSVDTFTTDGSWVTYDIKQISGTSVAATDGVNTITHTTRVGTIAENANIASRYTTTTVFVDWIVVRKYASPNPTAQLGAEESPPTPPDPTNLQNTTGNFWVNYTWDAGTGNITNGYNVTWNSSWYNTTNEFMNKSVGASNWANITVYAWNSSSTGTMSAGNVSDQVKVSAEDTSFTVTLPNGYTIGRFGPVNSTDTNVSVDGQTDSVPFYNVTNTGNVDFDVKMDLNETVPTVTAKLDTDNNPDGAHELNTTLLVVYEGLGQGNSVDIWLWSDFDHTPAQLTNRTVNISSVQ